MGGQVIIDYYLIAMPMKQVLLKCISLSNQRSLLQIDAGGGHGKAARAARRAVSGTDIIKRKLWKYKFPQTLHWSEFALIGNH